MNKVDLSTYSNSGYEPGSVFKRALWYVVSLLFFQSYLCPSSRVKRFLLRAFGAQVGEGLVIKPGVRIKYPWFLVIGSYVWIGEDVWIDNLTFVRVGNHACLSQGAMILTGNHNYSSSGFDLMLGEITLEDGVWIGAKAMVTPGRVCQSHSVLTAGSVAYSDLDSYGIYTGTPAQWVKNRSIQ